MKKFLVKISMWIIPLVTFHFLLGYFFTDGNTDDYYRHFSVAKPQNIIIGDSRSSQGIVPKELNKVFFNRYFDNFSFTITHSPYGEIYYRALQRKLSKSTEDGIFILAVSPWNISTTRGVDGDEFLPEEESPINNMYCYDCSPNFEYLLKHYSYTWYYLYRDRESQGHSSTYLHKDGWLEVNVSRKKMEMKKRIAEKITLYQNNARHQSISPHRLKGLYDIINFLKPKGRVFLVRLPTGRELTKIENEYMPNFNMLMHDIAESYNVHYINKADDYMKYEYTDGNHLYKDSSVDFTQKLAEEIKSLP